MKKALITGASTGLGLEFAHQLRKQNWDVFGVARSEDKLKTLFDDEHYLVADLTLSSDVEKVVTWINTHSFDLLINNAGFGSYSLFSDSTIDSSIQMMHLNMDALVSLSYAYLKTAKTGDSLINVSSALSLLPMPGAAVYSATKSFVTAFTECLWYEYKQKGIYVFASLPGPVATPFHQVAGGSTAAMDPRMVLTPEAVVAEALKTLNKRSNPSVVHGFSFKIFTKLGQLMSRKLRLSTMAKNGPVTV
jgi:short-subunit dehydrogenase